MPIAENLFIVYVVLKLCYIIQRYLKTVFNSLVLKIHRKNASKKITQFEVI